MSQDDNWVLGVKIIWAVIPLLWFIRPKHSGTLVFSKAPFKVEGKFNLKFDPQNFYIMLITITFLIENFVRVQEINLVSLKY
jgi:hypothetical protein